MKTLTEHLVDFATIGAGLSAIAIAGVVLLRDSGSASERAFPLGEVGNWEEYSVGHRRGADDPMVTIVEFGDYLCPFCRAAEPHLLRILAEFGDKVAVVYRHMPLPGHDGAFPAAMAAECSAEQGRFWEFHDRLYADVDWHSADHREAFGRIAEEVMVADIEDFKRCMEDNRYAEKIAADVTASAELSMSGTPSFLINGRRHLGVLDFERFEVLFRDLEKSW